MSKLRTQDEVLFGLLKANFGEQGIYDLGYSDEQIDLASIGYREYRVKEGEYLNGLPYSPDSFLGICRGVLEQLIVMFNPDGEVTQAQNDAWVRLGELYSPEILQ